MKHDGVVFVLVGQSGCSDVHCDTVGVHFFVVVVSEQMIVLNGIVVARDWL
jgi:hypothetical protein